MIIKEILKSEETIGEKLDLLLKFPKEMLADYILDTSGHSLDNDKPKLTEEAKILMEKIIKDIIKNKI